MDIAVGSDERANLTDAVVARLRRLGHRVELYGALAGKGEDWVAVALEVARRVASGAAQEGVLFCWTGTGVSIAANKVPGIRAALCADAETARGAKRWNHANILVMGLRAVSEAVAQEIVEAWFATPYGEGEDAETVKRLMEVEMILRPGAG